MASAPREEASNKREEKPKIFNDPSSPPPGEQGWLAPREGVEEAEEKNLDAVARKIRMLVRKVCERKQKHLRSQNRC